MQKNRYYIFTLLFLLLFPVGIAYAQVLDGWVTAKGHFCTLYIREDVDIKRLNHKIDTYRVDFGLSDKPLRLTPAPEGEVLYKFDLVFLKVQELLDMRPNKLHVDVRIYHRKNELDKLYVEIFSEKGDLIAFYVFKLNTIFACEEKISASVVAHEIAHCVIDHHFTVSPPKKIAEMIAHYAERHLRE